jgi:hypothetical protein
MTTTTTPTPTPTSPEEEATTRSLRWLVRLGRLSVRATASESGMAPRLRKACVDQMRAWYTASRWSGGGIAPEECPLISRLLRQR